MRSQLTESEMWICKLNRPALCIWQMFSYVFFPFFIYISWNFKNVILDGCLCWSCKSLLCCLLALSSTRQPIFPSFFYIILWWRSNMLILGSHFPKTQTMCPPHIWLADTKKGKNLSLFSFFLKLRFVMVGISTSCLPHFASWSPN